MLSLDVISARITLAVVSSLRWPHILLIRLMYVVVDVSNHYVGVRLHRHMMESNIAPKLRADGVGAMHSLPMVTVGLVCNTLVRWNIGAMMRNSIFESFNFNLFFINHTLTAVHISDD